MDNEYYALLDKTNNTIFNNRFFTQRDMAIYYKNFFYFDTLTIVKIKIEIIKENA